MLWEPWPLLSSHRVGYRSFSRDTEAVTKGAVPWVERRLWQAKLVNCKKINYDYGVRARRSW